MLTYPLWILFKRSLDDGLFPFMFKLSSIIPVLKSGSPSLISNYRLIAIQSHISKSFILYNIVKPILEYGCVVWDPSNANDSLQLERVQRKFLRFVSYSLNIHCLIHNYVSSLIELSSAERRRNDGIKFLNGLLNGNIDSPVLMSHMFQSTSAGN
jgi:hypothetical protein